MTTNHTYRLLPALLLLLLFFTTGCDSSTSALRETPEVQPGSFMIEFRQVAVSTTTMEGTFEASGSIDDRGMVQEEFDSSEPLHLRNSIHGRKTLVGQKGTLTIEFYAGLSRVDAMTLRASGGFRIVEGSGSYADLQGEGAIDVEVAANASPGEVTKVLEGIAAYARNAQ